MFHYYKPNWLYQSLPYLYVAAGLAAIYLVPNRLGVVSGSLFIFSGVYVWVIRQLERRRVKAEKLERHTRRPRAKHTECGNAL